MQTQGDFNCNKYFLHQNSTTSLLLLSIDLKKTLQSGTAFKFNYSPMLLTKVRIFPHKIEAKSARPNVGIGNTRDNRIHIWDDDI